MKDGAQGNIIHLIKGAFWCKGYDPSWAETEKDDYYGKGMNAAIVSMQEDAGIKSDGILTVNFMAALFDMMAFALVRSGDKNIRQMRQYLNSQFSNDMGIMPCDVVYQRDTNVALIFALQKAINVPNPNGNYGPATIKATPTVKPGASGAVVKVIQYGLYVNGFYEGTFDGNYSDSVSEGMIAFRKFMNLPDFTGISDLTVIKGLLTSNGNTNRDSNMLDTSTQLTAADVTNLKKYGFQILGRYLTGSVGTGKDKRNKYLTSEEINNIISEGLSIFPIYEDGGYEEKYFNGYQGLQDAYIASKAASNLGFPEGTTIYFALDVDIQDGDIPGIVEPYITGIINGLSNTGFKAGLYGTRNVCLHGEKLGIESSFVADMSYGWSGNLGFKMPKNWAFDQFVEYSIGGTPIDQGASSGKDVGVKKFTPTPAKTISSEDALKMIGKSLKDSQSKLTFDHEITIIDYPYIKATLEAEAEFKNTGSDPIFTIKNGKYDSASISEYLIKEHSFPKVCANLMVDQLGKSKISETISFGNVSIKVETPSINKYKVSYIYNVPEVEGKTVTGGLSITFAVEVEPITFVKEKLGDLPSEIAKRVPKFLLPVAMIIVICVLGALLIATTGETIVAAVITIIIVGIKSLIPTPK